MRFPVIKNVPRYCALLLSTATLFAAATSCGDQRQQTTSDVRSEMVSANVSKNLPSLYSNDYSRFLSSYEIHRITQEALAEALRDRGLDVSFFDDEWFRFEIALDQLSGCDTYPGYAYCADRVAFRLSLSLTEDGDLVDHVSTRTRLKELTRLELRQRLVKGIDRLMDKLVRNGALDQLNPQTPWYDPQTPWY